MTTSKEKTEEPGCCCLFDCIVGYCKKTKFGTWDGVYLSCLLSMFGVIMFLRLGYIIGEAGVWQTWIIEFISAIVVFVTTLSMSALCTNGEVRHGGAYYLISRSLGPEIGGSIGILFTIGNSIAVSMHILGFAEPMVNQIGKIVTNSEKNDLRVYGTILLFVLLIFAFIGVGWMIKIQFLIAFVLIAAIICFFVGCFITIDLNYLIVSVGNGAFMENFNSAYTEGTSFVTIFGVFFPAMTGIMAGANLSGDLINPSNSIPTGTLTSVITAWAVYMAMSTIIADSTLRGDPSICSSEYPSTGLCYNLIMEKIAVPGEIIYAGVYAATLSSALAALIGAPRILTTVANDKLLSILNIFAIKRNNGEPLFAYIPAALISFGCIMIASINTIATVVTITYLITYALINFACFQSLKTNVKSVIDLSVNLLETSKSELGLSYTRNSNDNSGETIASST
ncbi:hypothetical protein MHBO_000073 [Bonamia ostreae]|uniref:Amino acid permease/ SLC12A domain-containing protein n=1 Tax=Bonamia ostreae TaxID=126728 RepID=A0ABV2AED6_9EUKA